MGGNAAHRVTAKMIESQHVIRKTQQSAVARQSAGILWEKTVQNIQFGY